MIEDDNQQILSEPRHVCGGLQAVFSESKLRKTATKPAEFSSSTQISRSRFLTNHPSTQH